MIEEFLNNFYDCLHFSQTEAFPADALPACLLSTLS